MDEKKCPYCAEIIKAEAIKCRFCGSDLLQAAPTTSSARPARTVAGCQGCNVALVPAQIKKFVSIGGIIGIVILLIGLSMLAFNAIAGVIVMILGVLVGSIGNKKTVMVCPKCGERGATIAS